MEPEFISVVDARFAIRTLGLQDPNAINILWGHGWGQSGRAMLPLAESLAGFAFSTVIDFPGFGSSPIPPDSWGTEEYAAAIAAWLLQQPLRKRFWVGHSFGGRVGIQLAARYPNLLHGLILIASAGLKRKRSRSDQARVLIKQNLFKAARTVLGDGQILESLRSHLGSPDYRNAGPLRPILTRVINEDLSEVAAQISCPVLLIYGESDTETPPEMGRRFHSIIKNSKLVILSGLDHHSILGEGRHLTARHILTALRGDAR